MDTNELFSMLAALGGAALLGVLCMIALGWFIDIQKHFQKWLMPLIFPILIVAMCVGALLSGRNVTYADLEPILTGEESAVLTWFFRLTTAFIFGICLARFVSVSQTHSHRSREGRTLFLAFLLYYLTNVVLNNIFGDNPAFYERFVSAAIVFVAFYFSRNQDRYYAIQTTKCGLLLMIAGSCIAALAMPSIAVQQNYEGYLPGTGIRLWGLATNPNSIGPLSVLFLLLLAHQPFRRRWLQYAAIALGLTTLLLAQSKTAWGAALLAFSIVYWARAVQMPAAPGRMRAPHSLRNFAAPMLACAAGLLLIAGFAFFTAYEQQFTAIANERQLTTLTGRTEIWSVAIDAWKSNPLFGHGSSIWGEEFRKRIGMDFAVSAHSQFMQSLSEAGTIGFVALIVYFFLLWRASVAANVPTRGLSLAIFSLIFVRAITETPLDLTTIFNGEFLMHLLLFRLVLVKGVEPRAVPYPQMQAEQQLRWS